MSLALISDALTVFSIIAIFENLLLMPIILFKSGKEIGSYKYLLFIYCMIAVIYMCIALIVILEPGPKGWLFYATGKRVSQTVGSRMIATFANCYIALMLILEASFVYRYFVMCKRHALKWFNKPQYLCGTLCLVGLILAICGFPIYSYMCQNTDIAVTFEEDKVSPPQLDLYQVSYVGAPMYMANGWPQPETASILIIWTLAMNQFVIVASFCTMKIMKCFKTVNLTAANRKLQYRLFVLLLFQTIVPCVFTFSPPLFTYVFAFLRLHVPMITQVSTAFLPIAHVIDPILIIFVVTDYRRFLKKLIFVHIFRKKNAISDESSVQRSSEYHTECADGNRTE